MRIAIVGGGPAGLYFSILMKRLDPSHEIGVYERDGPDDTFGWGIVFSDQTFSYLAANDEPSFRRIVSSCEIWEDVVVVRGDDAIAIGGNRFSGIGRLAFLQILHDRCRELGVDLRFRTAVAPDALPEACDLLVGADGANSTVRARFRDEFGPQLETGRNKYIWLGTPRLFHGLTLTFRESPDGMFAAHSYQFNSTTSTFIVECSEATWRRAGFERMSERQTCAYLEEVFGRDLQGQPLLTNNFVKWLNFLLVRNERWFGGRKVLLGDALHTAHFSIGSGTKLALGDAIALASALGRSADVDAGLAAFVEERRPVVEAYQEAARESLVWFEQMERWRDLDSMTFAYNLMTRSKRIDRAKLERRDPAFVAAYESRRRGGPRP